MFPLTRSLTLAAAGAIVALQLLAYPLVPTSWPKTSDQSGLGRPSSPGLAVNAS